jgi:membrane peptidoglycan carboxypeptidase
LPIWLEFMQNALAGMPVETFPNVEPLAKIALTKVVHVDTPDSAPTEASEEGGGHNAVVPKPPSAPQPAAVPQPQPPANPPDPPSTGVQAPPDPRGQ